MKAKQMATMMAQIRGATRAPSGVKTPPARPMSMPLAAGKAHARPMPAPGTKTPLAALPGLTTTRNQLRHMRQDTLPRGKR